MKKINVTIWNENIHDQSEEMKKIYPDGIHGELASMLARYDKYNVRIATLQMPEHGLTEEVIKNTDVLLWWGHVGHNKVSDEIVQRVHDRVLEGMGFIPLHSGHGSKPFKSLIGTTSRFKWRLSFDRERIWNVCPTHPIAAGVPDQFVLEPEETYGGYFDIPKPDDIIFLSWYSGGEIFRSGCTFTRGNGKIFYFSPGHEEYPTFKNEYVRLIIRNGIDWAAPTNPSAATRAFGGPCKAPEDKYR